jgi:hypothetical protein
VKRRERVDALLDRIAYRCADLKALGQQCGRLQIGIGNLVTLDDERHSLAMKRDEIEPSFANIAGTN